MLLLHRGEAFDANFYYHSGVDIDHAFLLAGGGRKTLLVPRMNAGAAKAEFRGKVAVYENAQKSLAALLKGGKVRFDGASMSAKMAAGLGKICRLEDYSAELLCMRMAKRADEVALIRKAARTTREIIESLDIKSARTELGLKKQLMLATVEHGAELAFEPIVATDRNSSYPHHSPSKKRLGSVVLVDYGVRCGHYCADVSRCFILDGDRKKKEEYERLRGVCHSIIDGLPKLKRGKDVAAFAAKAMQRAGFPKMIHAPGHGVGLDIHEPPRLGPKSIDRIAGAAMAIEPAFYGSRYGMRYEETIHFDGKKARIL